MQMKQLKLSFFDDNDEKARKAYKFWSKSTNTLALQEVQIQGYLSKKNNSSSRQWKQRLYGISDQYLIKFKVDEKVKNKLIPVKFLDLTNKRIDKIKFDDKTKSVIHYGFRITHNLQCKEFFIDSLETTLKWFNVIKLHCIQTTFHNDYEAIKQLGKGSFARVYLAQNKHNNERFAIKAFEKEKIKDDVDKISIKKEIQLLRKLNHPAIIKLHETYENSSYIFLIKELLHGGELLQRILNSGVYTEKIAAVLMKNLFSALTYMHSLNIIHRDIKPENIILKQQNNDTEICVTDFGLADFYNPKGDYLFKRCGTPGYCAPEILEDQIYDFKVDCFSAGVIMFIIITGCSPFYSTKYEEIVQKNLKCQIEYSKPEFKQQLSAEAIDLLKNLLEKNPAKRFTALQALQHPWFNQSQRKESSKQQEQHKTHEESKSVSTPKNIKYNIQINQDEQKDEVKEQPLDSAVLKKKYAEDLGILNSPQVEFRSPFEQQQQQAFTFDLNNFNLQQNQDSIIENQEQTQKKQQPKPHKLSGDKDTHEKIHEPKQSSGKKN